LDRRRMPGIQPQPMRGRVDRLRHGRVENDVSDRRHRRLLGNDHPDRLAAGHHERETSAAAAVGFERRDRGVGGPRVLAARLRAGMRPGVQESVAAAPDDTAAKACPELDSTRKNETRSDQQEHESSCRAHRCMIIRIIERPCPGRGRRPRSASVTSGIGNRRGLRRPRSSTCRGASSRTTASPAGGRGWNRC
jgi:hypothetical protein